MLRPKSPERLLSIPKNEKIVTNFSIRIDLKLKTNLQNLSQSGLANDREIQYRGNGYRRKGLIQEVVHIGHAKHVWIRYTE